VLLIAPLAAVPDAPLTAAAADAVLAGLDADDAAAIWQAITLARPGGLGRSDRWDVAGPPPPDIRAAMRQAARRDTIARLWSDGYAELFAGPATDLAHAVTAGMPLEAAIVRTHLRQLAREPDSLIARRHGSSTAIDVTRRAVALVCRIGGATWPAELAAFDSSLRQPRRLNPGTTADLVAAAIYILLRDGRLRPALPFATPSFTGIASS
jgi:triphosphoribosyl-dephospho-CoA synthase